MWENIYEKEFLEIISSIKFSNDGLKYAISFINGNLSIFDSISNSQLISKQVHKKGINQIKWSKDSNIIITCSDDGTLLSHNSLNLNLISTCKGHHSYVTCCDISILNDRLISGSYDESIRVWETTTGECLRMISAHSDPISAISFNSDGRFIISSSWDGFCRFFETFSGICVKSINLKGSPISQMIISPNDSYLLISLIPSKILLIDIKDSKIKSIYEGYKNEKFGLFTGLIINNKNDIEIYSGSEDCIAIGWDLFTSEIKWKIEGSSTILIDYFNNNLITINEKKLLIYKKIYST